MSAPDVAETVSRDQQALIRAIDAFLVKAS